MLRKNWRILAAITVPMILTGADSTIVAVAYNDIAQSLGATLDEIAWMTTAYMLAATVALPLTGWISARFGRKNAFMGSLGLFLLGSLLCALAQSPMEIAVFRLIQGAGGGLLDTLCALVAIAEASDAEREHVIVTTSILAYIGPILGPLLGGILLTAFSWPMIFLINVPIGVLCVFLIKTLPLKQDRAQVAAPASAVSLGMLLFSLLSFQYAIQYGARLGWFESRAITTALLLSIATMGAFLVMESRKVLRIVDVRHLRNREMLISNVLAIISVGSMYGMSFIVPLFLQEALGYTPLLTGAMTIPAALGLIVSTRLYSRARKYVSRWAFIAAGFTLFAVTLWLYAYYGSHADVLTIVLIRGASGIGLGLFYSPLISYGLSTTSRETTDSAAGMSGFLKQIIGTITIAAYAGYLDYATRAWTRTLDSQIPAFPAIPRTQSAAVILAEMAQHARVIAYQHLFDGVAALMLLNVALIAAIYVVLYRLRTPAKAAISSGR